MDRLSRFVDSIPRDIPLAIECRNGSWLDATWFDFLKSKKLSCILSEKQYLPHITELYENYGAYLVDPIVVQLLGGDRAEIEKLTDEVWNRIVDPKPQLPAIAAMLQALSDRGKALFVNVNNHFEGSAPRTIERLQGLLSG